MDRTDSANRFSWLPREMPGVARLMKEKRATLGEAHVRECWRRGVIEREPGWFYAREGAIAIGVLGPSPEVAAFATMQLTAEQVLLVLHEPEVANGAH
jgi:hypothetical protein